MHHLNKDLCPIMLVGGCVTMPGGFNVVGSDTPSIGGYNMTYIYIKKVKRGSKIYYYLVIEEYLGDGKRKLLAHIPVKKILEHFLNNGEWCGGWDLNPRRPTPSGPKPDPFDQARAPPLSSLSINFKCGGFKVLAG